MNSYHRLNQALLDHPSHIQPELVDTSIYVLRAITSVTTSYNHFLNIHSSSILLTPSPGLNLVGIWLKRYDQTYRDVSDFTIWSYWDEEPKLHCSYATPIGYLTPLFEISLMDSTIHIPTSLVGPTETGEWSNTPLYSNMYPGIKKGVRLVTEFASTFLMHPLHSNMVRREISPTSSEHNLAVTALDYLDKPPGIYPLSN